MLKVGTDFSGIGSPEIALKNLGVDFKSMFACDYDKYAKQSYLANHKTENFYDDITTRDHTNTPYVDLYVAGFPCQAFSMAGNRRGFDDTRGTLFFDLLQYLKAQRPKYFILENVKGLMSHDKGKTFSTIINILAKTINGQMFMPFYSDNIGYHIYHQVLNTKDFGIPQNRERIFIVGFRDDKHSFKFPNPFKLELKLKDILQDNPDSKYYLSNKVVSKLEIHKKNNKLKGNGFGAKYHNPEKDLMSTISAGGRGMYDLIEVDEKYYLSDKAVDKLETYNDNNNIKVHSLYPRSSKTGKGGSGPLSKDDGTTYCIDTGNAQAIEIKSVAYRTRNYRGEEGKIEARTDNRIRRLTPLECLRLQGFPDEFYYKCVEAGLSNTQIYKQAGNSMTSDVMYYLIKEILKNGY